MLNFIYIHGDSESMAQNVLKESLAEKTRMYIDAHPSIKDCVSKGLVNYSSLARLIMKDIDVDNEEAVMIACRRYASKLSVTTDHEMSILRILKDRIMDTVGRFNIIKVRENLVEIAVKSPEKIVDTSGVIAYLITNLSDAGINIEETVSCHTDTIFIVGEADMINAYSVLTKCIQSAEATVGDQ